MNQPGCQLYLLDIPSTAVIGQRQIRIPLIDVSAKIGVIAPVISADHNTTIDARQHENMVRYIIQIRNSIAGSNTFRSLISPFAFCPLVDFRLFFRLIFGIVFCCIIP